MDSSLIRAALSSDLSEAGDVEELRAAAAAELGHQDSDEDTNGAGEEEEEPVITGTIQ